MMSKKTVFAAAIITTLLLGCDSQPRAEAGAPSGGPVSINPLPVIMSVVAGEVPELTPGNSEAVLNRVCQVAYGEVKLPAFREEINQSGIVKEKQGALEQLLKSDDIAPYGTICAAYMIQSVATIPDVNQYVTQQKNADGQTVSRADEAAVINLMPFRLAVARATAELYARIAADLPEKKAQSPEQYNQKIQGLFSRSAAGYLETVRKYNKEEINHRFQLLLLQKGKFTFRSSTGYVMDISTEGMNLYLYGTPWLANGYILGMTNGVAVMLK
ncbi:nitrogen fixation protein NifZ [Citrobacter braakii]|nr:nitrogen fixation protein NifZ [Citrobacter braakii]